MTCKLRTLLAIVVLGGVGLLAPGRAFADPPSIPPLAPPAPAYYTCQATGAGPICRGEQHFVDSPPAPSGVLCGTTAQPVELLIGGTDDFRRTRYYDTAGDLTRRFTHEDFAGTVYDPATGRTVQTTQIADFTDTLAVPGDLASATYQQTGVVKFFLPGAGVLLRDVGREVVGPDGNDLALSGQHQLGEYFNGDHSVLAPLCAALGSPGTP